MSATIRELSVKHKETTCVGLILLGFCHLEPGADPDDEKLKELEDEIPLTSQSDVEATHALFKFEAADIRRLMSIEDFFKFFRQTKFF